MANHLGKAWFDHLIPDADLIPEIYPSFAIVVDVQREWLMRDVMVIQSFWHDFSFCTTTDFGLN